MAVTAIAINCTLKSQSDESSSTDKMINLIAKSLAKHKVSLSETIRAVDFDIKAGVKSDEGEGDAWPAIRKRILDSDILILGTPVWLGQMSSVAKRVLEKMDAFLGETDKRQRMPSFSKVAVAAIVGNEDGAHAISADIFQALNDVGWTIPAAGVCYWVGEAMGSTNFKDLRKTPKKVQQAADMLASNAAHLARLLQVKKYPGIA